MTPVPILFVREMLVAAVVFAFNVDFAKVPVFHRLRIARRTDEPKRLKIRSGR